MIIVNYFTCKQPIKTDYRIYGSRDDQPLITVVTKNNHPHPDYITAILPLYDMIRRFCGFDILTKSIVKRVSPVVIAEDLEETATSVSGEWDKLIILDKVIFPRSDKKGDGIKISFYLNIPNFGAEMKMTTPVFWSDDLTAEEQTAIALMKEEAYAYAHENKQAQTELEFIKGDD